MANSDFRSGTPVGKSIRTTDYMFGADPLEGDLSIAARTDRLSEVILTIFRNLPTGLTPVEQAAIWTALDVVSAAGVTATADARAAARYTDAEKAKVLALEYVLDLGDSPTQAGARFDYAAPSGYTAGSFAATGQFVQFGIGAVTGPTTDGVVIRVGADDYTLTGLSARSLPLEELRADTQYLAWGKGTVLTLIGPTDLVDDDVVDVTDVGLPVLDAANYNKIYIDHDTPRAWIGHREPVPGTPATGTFNDYADSPNYLGVRTSDPGMLPNPPQYYYNRTSHTWRGHGRTGGFPSRPIWVNRAFSSLFGSVGRWLGEQPDDATAAGLVMGYTDSLRFYYYNTTARNIQQLNGTTYVPPVDPTFHYDAEPISTPMGVGTIAGITAGTGLEGGGLSGVVSLSVAEDGITNRELAVSGTPAANQVVGWNGSALQWQSDDNDYADQVGLGVAGSTLSINIRRTGSLAALTSSVALPSSVLTTDSTLAGDGTASDPLGINTDAITPPFLSAPASPTDGQILSYRGTGSTFAWIDAGGITAISTDTSISGDGTAGDPLAVDETGAAFPIIPLGKGGTGATDAAGARSNLGLGTAATLDSGAASGDVPVLDGSGHLLDSVIPDSIARDSELSAAIDTWATAAVTGNTETGINVTYDTNRKLNFVVTGLGIHTTAAFTGDGTTQSPIGLANNAITEPNLSIGNLPTDTQVLSWDAANSRLLWKNDETASPGSGITMVSHSAAFTGMGTAADPLDIADGGILTAHIADGDVTEPKLDASNTPTADQILSWDGTSMTWVDQTGGGGAGDITSVTAGAGLTGGGASGDVTLDIDVSEASFPTIPVVKGGTGAVTAAAARTNLGLGTAVTSVSRILRNFVFGRADGTDTSLGTGSPFFQGYGHAVFEAGDNFIATPGGTTFQFGDSVVVDDVFYVSFSNVGVTGVQPANVSTQASFFAVASGGGTGDITGVAAGTGLSGGGASGDVTLAIAAGGVGTTQLADEAVSEAKLDISNTPASDQVLSWSGTALAWADVTAMGTDNYADSVAATVSGSDLTVTIGRTGSLADLTSTVALPASGGTGDITGVAAGTGLSGGGMSGDVTLAIAAGGVDTAQLADDAVTAAKLANNSVGSAAITTNAVTTSEIADNAVTGAKIASTAVDSAQLAGASVTSGKIAVEAVTEPKLGDGAVITRVVGDEAITEPKLDISNAPTADQVLSWSGTALAWIAQTGGGDDNYADSVAATLSGSDLTVTVGRTGSLADLTSTVAVPAGDITGVAAGYGLTGGGISGAVSLAIDDNVIGEGQLQAGFNTRKWAAAAGTYTAGVITLGFTTAQEAPGDTYIWAGPAAIPATGTQTLQLRPEATLTALNLVSPNGTQLTESDITAGQIYKVDFINDLWVVTAGLGSGTGTGDISGVTAGTGLTGGGTRGNVTLGVAASGIDTTQLADDAVTAAKLANNSVGSAAITTNAVTTSEIASNAVTGAKIADDTIVNANIAGGAVSEAKLNVSNAPSANQLLSWDGANLAWTDAGAGTGDITAVTTAADSGLTGGVDSGAANLAIGALGVTTARLASEAVTEPKLDVSNAPASDQVLSWDGTELAWVDQTAGTPGTGEFDRTVLTNYQDFAFAQRPDDDSYVDFTLNRVPDRGSKIEVTMRINLSEFDLAGTLTPSAGAQVTFNTDGTFSTTSYTTPPDSVGHRVTVGNYTAYIANATQVFNSPAAAITSETNFTASQGPLFAYSVCAEIDGDEWLDLPPLPARWGDASNAQRSSMGSTAFSISTRINRGSTQLTDFGHSVFYVARKSDTTFSIACPNWHSIWPNAATPSQGRFQIAFQIREVVPEAVGGSGTGDITGVTAGAGLTGGGDSGAVTLSVGNNAITSVQLASPFSSRHGATGTASYTSGAINLNLGSAYNFTADGDVYSFLTPNFGVDALTTQLSMLIGTGESTLPIMTPEGNRATIQDLTGLDVIEVIAISSSWHIVSPIAASLGDITGITTAANSGLTGGVDAGVADLEIAARGITSGRLADSAVTTAKLNDDAVTAAKLANNSVGNAAITSNAVTTSEIADNAVTGAKIAANTIAEANLNVANLPGNAQVLTWVSAGSSLLWADAGTGDITEVRTNAGSGLAGGASSGISNLFIDADGVTTARIADDAVTEPKMAISGMPSAGQVISWSGAAMQWSNAGTGDITGVTAGTGLSGGGDSGAVTVNVSDGGIDTTQLADGSVSESKIDISNAATADQILSWSGTALTWVDATSGLASVATNFTLSGTGTTGDPLQIADVGVGSPQLATGAVNTSKIGDEQVTEPKLNVSNAPVSDYILSWNGTEMEWVAQGSTPTPTHTSYVTTGADAVFTEAEFTGSQGSSGTGNALALVDWTGSQYAAFARPMTAGMITELYFYAQGAGRGNNQVGAWTVETATLDIGGEGHYIVRSDGPLTFISGITFVIEVA